jgi:predicted aspartyl protease
MRVAYKDDMPLMRLKVIGPRGKREYDAYLDTGAGKCLIPEADAVELGLLYAGDTTVITGTGKDSIKLYRATISFLGREFSILVFGKDLPEQARVKAMIGRDIMDKYKIIFDGISKEAEVI